MRRLREIVWRLWTRPTAAGGARILHSCSSQKELGVARCYWSSRHIGRNWHVWSWGGGAKFEFCFLVDRKRVEYFHWAGASGSIPTNQVSRWSLQITHVTKRAVELLNGLRTDLGRHVPVHDDRSGAWQNGPSLIEWSASSRFSAPGSGRNKGNPRKFSRSLPDPTEPTNSRTEPKAVQTGWGRIWRVWWFDSTACNRGGLIQISIIGGWYGDSALTSLIIKAWWWDHFETN